MTKDGLVYNSFPQFIVTPQQIHVIPLECEIAENVFIETFVAV